MTRDLTLTNRRISLHRLHKLIGSIAEHIQRWRRNHRTRQQLSRLDDHQLPDLGLTSVDCEIESQKWFWQA
ncbi:MAG: DUF1127 domain-containing protein [Geminicoccaceae bacterium]